MTLVNLNLSDRAVRLAVCLTAMSALGACEAFKDLALFDPLTGKEEVEEEATGSPLKLVQRDVETPSAFSVQEKAVWDGRPSLGGIWVAYPGNVQPERVNIRNTENGKTVVGALFKRERQNPGPSIQVSSDAANALGIVPGKPVELSVIALRREAVDTAPPAIMVKKEPTAEPEVEVVTIDDAKKAKPSAAPTTSAAKKGSSEAAKTIAAAVQSIQTTPLKPTAETATSDGTPKRAYVQVGVFAKEANANKLARQLTDNGILSTARALDAGTKTLYRVVAGPASSLAELKSNLAKIKAQGFSDAYTVTR